MMHRINQARRAYDSAVSPGAAGMQEALMQLVGKVPLGQVANRGSGMPGQSMVAGNLDRMAASDEMLALLKAMPAAGAAAVGGSALATAGDLVTGDESMNRGMDLLGMGAGGAAAYGINRGMDAVGGTTKAGMALRLAAGMGLGKLGSDATQGVVGGMF
jgi:hypothetical protein